MQPITSAGLSMCSGSPSTITTSNSMTPINNSPINYPQLTPLPTSENHLYNQSPMTRSIMNLDMSHSPTFLSNLPAYKSFNLELIKSENGPAPHIAHTNLSRELNGETEKNNNTKALDLEMKQHRLSLSALTNIESR